MTSSPAFDGQCPWAASEIKECVVGRFQSVDRRCFMWTQSTVVNCRNKQNSSKVLLGYCICKLVLWWLVWLVSSERGWSAGNMQFNGLNEYWDININMGEDRLEFAADSLVTTFNEGNKGWSAPWRLKCGVCLRRQPLSCKRPIHLLRGRRKVFRPYLPKELNLDDHFCCNYTHIDKFVTNWLRNCGHFSLSAL